DAFLEQNGDAVGRLGRALAKATLFAQTNPDAAVQILAEVNPEGSTDLDQLRASLDVAIEAIAPAEGQPYGDNDVAAWQSLVDGMLLPGSQSGLNAPIDPAELVDNALV